MGCPLDDPRAFGIHTDQWTTAAQDEEEWCKTAEQKVERFMAKWIVAEKLWAGLRYAVVVSGQHIQQRMNQSGMIANPARGQLNREMKVFFSVSPFAPENLILRDGFGRPVPRQTVRSPHSG